MHSGRRNRTTSGTIVTVGSAVNSEAHGEYETEGELQPPGLAQRRDQPRPGPCPETPPPGTARTGATHSGTVSDASMARPPGPRLTTPL